MHGSRWCIGRAVGVVGARVVQRHAGVGRLAVSVGALPAVVPVAFAVVADVVVFPATVGSDLEAP